MCGRFALYSPYPKLTQALRLILELGELTPRANVALDTWITALRHPSDDAPFTELVPALCDFPKALAGLEKVIVLNQRTFQSVEFWANDETPDLRGTCEKII